MLYFNTYEQVGVYKVWTENKDNFDFVTPYVDETTPVELRCKYCGEMQHYYPNKAKHKFTCSCYGKHVTHRSRGGYAATKRMARFFLQKKYQKNVV